MEEKQIGTLYLVPTPIGNLEDMTFRAVHILQNVDWIAAEDTRNTQKLLNHFEITNKQISFHEHNTQERLPKLLNLLKAGDSIAQVSDAGMPSISDPGKELVAACIQAHITVIPLPGPNAGLTALIASGLSPQPFLFWGFLPRKTKEQQDTLKALADQSATMIFYESPYRVLKTVSNMSAVFEGDRQIVLARELTKRFEEFIRGSIDEVLQNLTNRPAIKGEFVILLAGRAPEAMTAVKLSDTQIKTTVQARIDQGEKPNQAIKAVAKQQQLPKQVVYNLYHDL